MTMKTKRYCFITPELRPDIQGQYTGFNEEKKQNDKQVEVESSKQDNKIKQEDLKICSY